MDDGSFGFFDDEEEEQPKQQQPKQQLIKTDTSSTDGSFGFFDDESIQAPLQNKIETQSPTDGSFGFFNDDPVETPTLDTNARDGLVGNPTGEITNAGRPVLETPSGELVSELSRTIPIGDKFYNVPSIYANREYTEDVLKQNIENNRPLLPQMIPTDGKGFDTQEEAIKEAQNRSSTLRSNNVVDVPSLEQPNSLSERLKKDKGEVRNTLKPYQSTFDTAFQDNKFLEKELENIEQDKKIFENNKRINNEFKKQEEELRNNYKTILESKDPEAIAIRDKIFNIKNPNFTNVVQMKDGTWIERGVPFIGFRKVNELEAAMLIYKGNTFKASNFALNRGWGNLKNVANVIGMELGFKDPEDFFKRMAELNRVYPQAPENIQKGLKEISDAEGWGESFKAIMKNPQAMVSVVGESLVTSAPAIGSFIAGTLVTANPITGAILSSPASFATEYSLVLTGEINELGIDLDNEEEVKALVNNQEFWAKARAKGKARGIPIAVFDALSMGLAGKIVAPVLKEGWKKVTAASIAEVGVQGILGGAGERAAQQGEIIIGQREPGDINEGDVLVETAAEFLPGSVEIAANLNQSRNAQRDAEAQKEYDLEIQSLARRLSDPQQLSDVDPSKVLTAERVEETASQEIDQKKDFEQPQTLEIDNPQTIPPDKEIGFSLNTLTGNKEEEQTQTPVGEKYYSTEFVLVDIRQLKQAEGKLQPRDRTTKESEVNALRNATPKIFNPKRLMDSPTTGDGTPIIAKDGTIMSGNGRVITMTKVYQDQDVSLGKYKTELESFLTNKIAKDLKVSPSDPKVKEDVAKLLSNYEQPLLVRRLTDSNLTIDNLSEFADLANRPAISSMSATESAVRDANAMGEDIVNLYKGGDLTSTDNADFVSAFISKVVTDNEMQEFSSDGQLTNQAVTRMKSAILASAFRDNVAIRKMIQSTNDNVKTLTNALITSAPRYVQLKSKISKGNIKPEFDITDNLTNTALLISSLREKGVKPNEYLNQTDAFDTKLNPIEEALLRAFYNDELTRATSQKFMETVLDYYIQEVENVSQENQMFAVDVKPEEVVQGARRKTLKERKGGKDEQESLFGDDQGKGNESGTKEGSEQVQTPISKRGSDDTGSVDTKPRTTEKEEVKGDFPEPNENGVYSRNDVKPEDNYEITKVVDATVQALEVAPNQWVSSASLLLSDQGASYPLGGQRFGSKEEAIKSAIDFATSYAQERPDDNATLKKQRKALRKFFDDVLNDIGEGDAPSLQLKPQGELNADAITRKIGKVDTEMDQGGLESTSESKKGKEGSTRGTKKGKITAKEMQTVRQSVFQQAFTDAGIEPKKAVNLEPKRQFKIVSDLVKEKFGFKYVAKGEVSFNAVQSLLDAYRNLQFMSHVLGLPNEKMSLDGEIGLALPSKATRYNAAYISANMGMEGVKAKVQDAGILEIPVIVMPERSNSFAHEWGHALDYHLLKRFGTDWSKGITGRIKGNLETDARPWQSSTPKSIQDTMADLINAMFFDKADLAAKVMELEQKIEQTKKWEAKTGKSTKKLPALEEQLKRVLEGSTRSKIGKSQYRKDAENFAVAFKSDPDYWTRPTEMFARVFEAYVASKVEGVGGTTEFITKSDAAYKLTLSEVEGADARLALTYPNLQDRVNMFLAMDRLMEAIRSDYWIGVQGANRPEDKNMVDARLDFFGQVNEGASKSRLKSLIKDQKLAWRINKSEKQRNSERPREYDNGILANTWHRTEDYVLKSLLYAKRGTLFAISRRNRKNPEIHKIIEDIISRVATDPGGTRVTFKNGIYEEAVRINTRRFTTELKNIIRRNKLAALSGQQMKDLRLVLTGNAESIQNIPQNIVDGAAEIRIKILNAVYDYAKQNDLPLTYLEDGSYLPRVLDMALFSFKQKEFLYGDGTSDKPSMKKGAYGLYHEVIYSNEVGQLEVGSRDQQKEMYRLMADNKPVSRERVTMGGQIIARMKRNIKDQDAINKFANLVPTVYSKELALKKAKENPQDNEKQINKLEKEIAELDQQLKSIHEKIYKSLQPAFAYVASQDWSSRITEQQGADIEAHSSINKFMKQRKLPKEADTFMIDFYTDPIEAITTYIPSVVRKVEQENRFGSKLIPEGQPKKDQSGKNIDYLEHQINKLKELGLNSDDTDMIKDDVNTIMGRTNPFTDRKLKKTSDFFFTMGTMAILGRAVMSSIAEPLTIGIQTGSLKKPLENMAYLIDEGLSGLTSRERTVYFRQMANILGVVDDPEVGEMVANRLGGTLQDSPTMTKWLSRYFVNTKLQGLTNGQRRSSMRVFLKYFVELSTEFKDPNTSDKKKRQIRNAFLDLGIVGQDLDQFTSFMIESRETRGASDALSQQPYKAPALEDVIGKAGELSDMGKLLAVAINRAVNSTIQDPFIVDRPKYAEMPIGRFVYGITSFSRAYTRNVLIASYNRVNREYKTNGAISATTMASLHILPQFGLLYAGHFAVSTAREALFNGDEWEKRSEEGELFSWLMQVAWSRAGFFGAFDPIAQVFGSLKYEADIKNLFAGAQLGFFANATDKILTFLGDKNSPNTLTSEYNAARGFFDTVGAGFISLLAATTPGPIAGSIAGAAAFLGTSSDFKKWVSREFIELIYGEELEIGKTGKNTSGSKSRKFGSKNNSGQRKFGER